MKKFFTLFAMARMALAFTSCEDEEIARTLEGTWKGEMYISTSHSGRTYYSTYTEITFIRDYNSYSSGTGYWVDYYSNAPRDYVANHINWTVDNGNIYIRFIEEGTRIEIRDYHLNDNHFSGTLYDNGNYVDFDMYNVSHPANYYNNYSWGYDYWDSYYYSRTRGDADSSQATERPVRFVNPAMKNK